MRNTILAAIIALSAGAASAQSFDAAIVGSPYPVFRENLRRGGFTPLIDGYACQGTDRRCDRYPEMGFCDPEPPGLCIGRWQYPDGRGFISVSTIGFQTPVVYIVSEKRTR